MNNENNYSHGIPRIYETLFALAVILALVPFFFFVAASIKFSSKGGVFFSQVRIGRSGRKFKIYKFRTMRPVVGAVNLTGSGDSRVTSVGKFLRKFKIDELPQLWNVVRGDMSFVGPRPEVPEYVDLKNPLWQEILSVRPGLTDPVTLRLRNEEDLLAEAEDKESFYKYTLQPFKLRGWAWFVREKSWKTDIQILARTFAAILVPQIAPPPSGEELLQPVFNE